MTEKQERLRLLEAQIGRLQRRLDRLEPRSNRYSWVRVAIFFGGAALSIIVLIVVSWWLALGLFAITVVTFGIVAHFHGKIERSITRHTLWLHIKSMHIARMKLDWEHIPSAYSEGLQPNHPFEVDLDITGPHSLHQLLNTAISRDGTLRLRDWLLNRIPDLSAIRQRQALVRELAPLTLFRDKLTLNSLLASGRVTEQLEGKRLLNWLARQTPSSALPTLFWTSVALNVLTIAFLIAGVFITLPQIWVFTLLASLLLFFTTAEQRGDVFEDATYLRYTFATLSSIFTYLETYPYGKHEHVKALCEPFLREQQHSPSRLLQHIARVSSLTTLKNNGLLWLIVNALLPWDFYCAYRLSQYKAWLSARLPAWLDAWFELEAVCSLATFAYLNPEYALPDILPCAELKQGSIDFLPKSLLQAHELGHPLIPVEKKVTNDFAMNELGEVVIITGSNMSGKSTFLRTVGVNLCLAYTGGPVSARMLQTTLLRLFTCIRVTDSVTDGYSYFYAEVRRLRALLNELEQPDQFPVFFLIDEIFKGTNNRERLIGSRSYVRAVAGRNCLGIISTHDLELVKLADILPQVNNYHFREEVINGRMIFDYILRSGPSPTTNALKIMAMEGLPVDDDIM
ncbi:MAG TPA: hypothetical protein VFB12_31360 [Ktedonobacteraceae bacterium]|nr:hypothetical protein [Ktedonobacteraceae bacterium]